MSTEELRNLTLGVLADGFLLSLGTVDSGGVWVADVTYIHDDDLNIYWVSYPTARHSKAIEGNPKVAGTVVAVFTPKQERAIQLEGTVRILDVSPEGYEQLIEKKSGNMELVRTGELKEKGYIWYCLTPTKIELIHNELFGYQKQQVL